MLFMQNSVKRVDKCDFAWQTISISLKNENFQNYCFI